MSSYQVRKSPGDTEWFRAARFGMFIHWGLYSMPARHEWIKCYERITEEKYDKYFQYFNPDLYNPTDWAKKAKAAGMKYVVFTTKHHEGCCMFDSQYTDYKCTNTPAGRDLVREFVDAFRAEGIRIGFYYSLIDWHHPQFPIDFIHPRCDDEDAEQQNEGRDITVYAQYMRDQIRELLTNYGKIDILWFDWSYPNSNGEKVKPWMKGKGRNEWESEKLIALARELQPGIIIDNRADIEQDLWTPEQYQVTEWVRHRQTGELVTWEACQTFSGSWGYHRDEASWKSPEMLVQMLVNTVSCGGNLLLNVGPNARGEFDDRANAALAAMAEWMRVNNRSIYNCTMAEPELLPTLPRDCRYTQSADGKRLYIHLFAYPFGHLLLRGLAGKVDYAQFLHDGSEILMNEGKVNHFSEGAAKGDDLLVLNLPVKKPNVLVPVIELFLK